jgi:hypothetical protein
MQYAKGLTYDQVKANINWMIAYYRKDDQLDPFNTTLTIDQLQQVYEINMEMVAKYESELLLLEANRLIGMI